MSGIVVSYHPALEADENLLLESQRPLDQRDREAMGRACAILLPQAPREDLHQMALQTGKPVFPRSGPFHARDGKLGNFMLFEELGLPHPRTAAFAGITLALEAWRSGALADAGISPPLVAKGAGGGEGRNVFLVNSPEELAALEGRLDPTCMRGPSGLVLQEYVDCGGRDARVIIMGERMQAFWRVAEKGEFRGNLSQGGRVDRESRPEDLGRAVEMAARLRRDAAVDLAAVDFLIPEGAGPLFLEINFYFGRKALGGGQAFLQEFLLAVRQWLQDLGLDGNRVTLAV